MHEGIPKQPYNEFGWLGRVSVNARYEKFFPPEIRQLLARPGKHSTEFQLYVDPFIGGPVAPGVKEGHFYLSELITLVNGRQWFERVFSIFGQ